MFKIGEIRELIRLLDETSVSEIQVDTDDMKLHIKKSEGNFVPVAQVANVAAMPQVAPAVSVAAPVAAPAATTPAASASPDAENAGLHVVTSPMVGTFYRSPSPDAPPYVEVGSKVSDKTVICIVEAMKLMNEIEAESTGEIVEVLAQNGQLVEYGQPLFKIKKS